MNLIWPIKNIASYSQISDKKIYFSQKFGSVWIADRDMTVGGVFIRKGENVYKKIADMNGHNGWDIAAPSGTPVYASCDGRVEFKKETGGYGLNARLWFDDKGLTYELVNGHLSAFVGSNRTVKQGELIGKVGSSGFSTAPHDHFGIRQWKDGKIQNYNNGYKGWLDVAQFIRKENMNVVTINIDGTIYVGHELNDPKDIPYANKFLGSDLVQEADGKIPTDIMATKK